MLVDGSRGVVAVGSALLVFVALAGVSTGVAPMTDYTPVFYVFGSLLGGNFTLIIVIVSINQLVLSQEFRTPTELREAIDGTTDYHRGIEKLADEAAPVEPHGFLKLIVETSRRRARTLDERLESEAGPELAEEVHPLIAEITDHADKMDRLLEGDETQTFRVLSVTLNTNYAKGINQLRRIKTANGHRLGPGVTEAIDDLIELLESVDIARQYLKTLYLQQELAALSRVLFYAGVPSIVVVTGTLLVFTAPNGVVASPEVATVLIPAAATVGLLPLLVLFAFILRTATVARQTVAIIPFTTPTQER